VAGRYRLSRDQIARAARVAQDAARHRPGNDGHVAMDDLFAAARAVSSPDLGSYAQRIPPRHTWHDIVLPEDQLAQLCELCDQFRYRHVVYDTWSMGGRSQLGRGLSVLFAGPSGTGKTLAAEVIARELQLDLFKIDLSGIVSKYVGETEKNLERIFAQARHANAILLFDEADALFGKRSETKDAHDRYANIEISYLLQKVEEYDGVVILTSNLQQNLDEAFLRRLHFVVAFPMPDEPARQRIWAQHLPDSVPRAANVDASELAKRWKFSGGSIRNVALSAAFLAARDGEVLTQAHLLWAARREFQKLGKLVDERLFAPDESGAS
jgi:SpoVK/Ycf46/Vps4 family AAA+-type ATPase